MDAAELAERMLDAMAVARDRHLRCAGELSAKIEKDPQSPCVGDWSTDLNRANERAVGARSAMDAAQQALDEMEAEVTP